MRYSFQILTVDTFDTKPSILISFDSRKYLFNCGEGTQRFCYEHGVKFSKMSNIFLSRANWESYGGSLYIIVDFLDYYLLWEIKAPTLFPYMGPLKQHNL